MRQTKSCACLIGTAVIDLERERRKNELRIKEIKEKLKNVKDAKKISKLKAEKKELMLALKETITRKKKMKRRFHKHIKEGGYAPLKFKKVNIAHSNQEILTHFFETIIRIVSEGTSDTYAAMVLTEFNKRNSSDFPFVKHININSDKTKINHKIDSVDQKLVAKYITKLINSLFSELFKHLLRRNMDPELYEDLKKWHVKI